MYWGGNASKQDIQNKLRSNRDRHTEEKIGMAWPHVEKYDSVS